MAICHNKQYEREFVRLMNKLGLVCFRIAGSGSAEEAAGDCVMYLPEPCLVEVKATKEEVFYLRSGIHQQLQKMIEISGRANAVPVLAIDVLLGLKPRPSGDPFASLRGEDSK